ncbi:MULTISPECIES: helix-turn-helix domain-containing protein [unclassified Serratia (in: enterobacteria)]|uniref:helix-turn-helix domain-containing protein n=1 Tax=unclassified Serratia (in: enterobacteria) TaxID=2647522 RepID=UPI0030764170
MMQNNISVPSWPKTPLGVKHFAERLESVMGTESIASFARGCHISAATVRKYLKSGTLPGIDNIAAISKYTGKSLAWLITGDEDSNSSNASNSPSASLTEEEIARWWGCISDALTVDDKIRIIAAFKQGGLQALFVSALITNKPTGFKGL